MWLDMVREWLPSNAVIYSLGSIIGTTSVVLYGRFVLKSKRFALFFLVFSGIHALLVNGYFNYYGQFPLIPYPMHLYMNLGLTVHLLVLSKWKRLKPKWYLYGVCLPAYFYLGWATIGSFSLIPWAIANQVAHRFGTDLNVWQNYFHLFTFGLSAHCFYLSLISPSFAKEKVHIDLRSNRLEHEDKVVELHSHEEVHDDESRILRVFQIADPHLGPFMSAPKLKKICENIVKHGDSIDLVLITGDMETMETHEDEHSLREALAPLKQIPGKVFACLGNHDYEVLDKVREAYKANDIVLLEDEQCLVEIPRWTKLRGEKSLVQIIGSTFSFAGTDGAKKHIRELCSTFPRISANVPRILLIHNPSILSSLDMKDESDIVLSGHLHGGQIGVKRVTVVKVLYHILNSFKSKSLFKSPPPDQGLYGRGKLRLYSHRGTGHYGFPLRLGIPSEHSLLNLYF